MHANHTSSELLTDALHQGFEDNIEDRHYNRTRTAEEIFHKAETWTHHQILPPNSNRLRTAMIFAYLAGYHGD